MTIDTKATTQAEPENLAATLARVLPTATLITSQDRRGDSLLHAVLPQGQRLESIDLERLLPNPRRTVGEAVFNDANSFTEYVRHHHTADNGATVWCGFNPQSYALSFVGVIDEHTPAAAGWRGHKATFTPMMSAEWKAWLAMNGKPMSQVDFAEWIENHEEDFAEANGLPTLLQLKTMATNFVARQEMKFKSAIRLQDGGARLEYVNEADNDTIAEMKLFERFGIGIPVFWGGQPWQITARLKYSTAGGRLTFRFELIRPDRVHEAAAKELIESVRAAVNPATVRLGTL
jgi:uncharacterized protein YfdQ (DUF2303 family)